jgi:hypothetical protein
MTATVRNYLDRSLDGFYVATHLPRDGPRSRSVPPASGCCRSPSSDPQRRAGVSETILAVKAHAGAEARRTDFWKVVVRAMGSLVVAGGLLFLLLNAAYLGVIQCGDSCPEDYSGDGRYTGQFVLACVGVLLGLGAVVKGFGRRGVVYCAAATGAAVVLFVWSLWVTGGTF